MDSKFLVIAFAAGTLALAQGTRSQQSTQPSGTGAGLDIAKAQAIEGVVTAVNIGYGSRYPSIQINQATIKVAPMWYLLDRDFEIKAGDKLKVTAAPCLRTSDPYLSAISLTNMASGISLTVRDAAGVPLWTMPQGRQITRIGAGDGTCAGPGGPVSIASMSGTVESVTAGLGIQLPTLVLKTSDTKLLTIKIGPERLLQAADFEISAGDALIVRYAVTCTGEMVALELTSAAGQTIVLRNDNGSPAWQ
jgi:hypothetical protein